MVPSLWDIGSRVGNFNDCGVLGNDVLKKDAYDIIIYEIDLFCF